MDVNVNLRITPGIQPRMVKQILIRKSTPHAVFKKTARGGMKIATMYAKTSACQNQNREQDFDHSMSERKYTYRR